MPRPDGPAGPSDGPESIGEPPETTPADMGGWAVDNKEKGMNDAKMLSMLTAVVDGTVRMISLSEESLRHGNPAPYLAKSSSQRGSPMWKRGMSWQQTVTTRAKRYPFLPIRQGRLCSQATFHHCEDRP